MDGRRPTGGRNAFERLRRQVSLFPRAINPRQRIGEGDVRYSIPNRIGSAPDRGFAFATYV